MNLGLSVTVPDGSYFILVNIEKIRIPEQELQESEREEAFFFPETTVPPRSKDWEVCRWLTTHVGVAAIPPSEFYKNGNEEASRYARFCFCKSDETLELAKERLQKLEKYIVS